MNSLTSSHSPHETPARRVLRNALGALATLALALSTAAFAADVFYEEQLRRGKRDYELASHASASRALEVAAFGLLDEPNVLADALLHLALAQAAQGLREDFSLSFERIAEIEDRFQAYTQLSKPQAKETFEEFARRWMSAEHLRLTPGFEALAQAPPTAEPEVRPSVRRRTLRAQLKEQPGDLALLQQLAALEAAQGKTSRALDYIDEILAADGLNAEAHCLRLALLTRRQECDLALESYAVCEERPFAPVTDDFLLSCMARSEKWELAGQHLSGLPTTRRQTSTAVEVEALVVQHLGIVPQARPAPTAHDMQGERHEIDDADPVETVQHLAPASLSPEDLALAQHIHDLTASAAQPSDLAEPARLAAELAQRRPDSSEAQYLAAEVAYRAGRWQDAVDYFRRNGEPGPDQPPLRLFYYAVSLFESGDRVAAAAALRLALPNLATTEFVTSYSRRILDQ